MTHHDYYRRALTALEMTNRDLAELLTEARHDGQTTSQATVSRWMTGATPIDAGVLLYLTERLRYLANSAIRRPAKTIFIGVGGGKGGTGGSTMAVALALISYNCGYRTMHVSSHEISCNNDLFLNVLPNKVKRSGPQIEINGILGQYDFVFVDLYRDFVRDQAQGLAGEVENIFNAIDIFVTPLDASSTFDVWGIKKMYQLLDNMNRDDRILVHFSSMLSVFGFDVFLKEMEPWKHMLYEQAIPRMIDGPFAEPNILTFQSPANAGFATADIYSRYWQLFAEVLSRVGLDAEESIDPEKLNFFELVDLLAPTATQIGTA